MTFHPLPEQFIKKGPQSPDYKDGHRKMVINYKQLFNHNELVFVYEVDYEGQIHYNVFISKMLETNKGIFALYPNDDSFARDEAFNFVRLESAKEKFDELVRGL